MTEEFEQEVYFYQQVIMEAVARVDPRFSWKNEVPAVVARFDTLIQNDLMHFRRVCVRLLEDERREVRLGTMRVLGSCSLKKDHELSVVLAQIALKQNRDVFLLADDYDLWLRIAEKYPTGNLADVLYQYRSHPTNISKTKSHLLQVYTDIARELARDRQQSGSDLLMRERPAAFWHKYGAQLKAAGLPEAICEAAVPF